MSKELKATRAKDRAIMAQQVRDAATAAGAMVTVNPHRDYAPRRISLNIVAPGGAHITFDIDGDCPIYGGTWNTPSRVFLSPVLGDVNPFHFGKLNRLAYDFNYALQMVLANLERFTDGSGYLNESDPRIVAMRDRYRANGWHWFGQAA